jgi:hypothetical protein
MSRLAPSPAPANVQAVFDALPAVPRACLTRLRSLILATAAKIPGVGPLTETLKWDEPAYLTDATKSGTTIRLGWKAATPDTAQILVHCSTTLVNEWRDLYSGTLVFSGTRAILVDITAPLPRTELAHCIAMALTYHSRKQAS